MTTIRIDTITTSTTCSLEEFKRDNVDDPRLVDYISNMKPGTTVEVGGGAEPITYITKKCKECNEGRSKTYS